MSSDTPFTFVYEVGGVEVSTAMSVEAAEVIKGWSTSIAIFYLGSEGPVLQEGLRQLFGE